MRILHLAPQPAWSEAVHTGQYRGSTRGLTLDEVGYVHASTAHQLPAVIEAVYSDDPLDDHVLLVVDVSTCEAAGSPVRWEVPEDAVEPFPHIYGSIPVQAVVSVLRVTRRGDGGVCLPDLTQLGVLGQPPRKGGCDDR